MRILNRIRGALSREPEQTGNDTFREFTTRIASSVEEHFSSFSLVHDCYVKEGYIPLTAHGPSFSLLHLLPTSQTFVQTRRRKMVGTASFVRDSHAGLPNEYLFGEEFDSLRIRGRSLAEQTLVATVHAASEEGVMQETALIKCMFSHAVAQQVDDILIVIHPKHVIRYEANYGFRGFGEQRRCGYLGSSPAVLMRADIRSLRRGTKYNPTPIAKILQMDGEEAELKPSLHYNLSEEEVYSILRLVPKVFARASEDERAVFRSYYPDAYKSLSGDTIRLSRVELPTFEQALSAA